jgi:phenylpropionate dioxygenase-like ring-hydroxylating dioxygenase large terminal subunit
MRNAWYVAAESRELLQDETLAVTILEEELVLFRNKSGQAYALANRCPHRGARLSDGKHLGERIACPFHGWEFEGDGFCARIPANGPDAPIPLGVRVARYPLCERGGYVWVWIGDPERVSELKVPPELTDEAYRAVFFQADWDAHLTRVVESILDVSHLPYVHPESTGTVDPRVEGPEFHVGDEEIIVIAKPFHPLLQTLDQYVEDRGASKITFHFPNQIILRTDMHQHHVMATYLTFSPLADGMIRLYGIALRNFLQDVELIDEIHYEHNVTVLAQDRPVVERLRPRISPLNLKEEKHVRSDAQQVRYRLMLKKRLEREPDPYYQDVKGAER